MHLALMAFKPYVQRTTDNQQQQTMAEVKIACPKCNWEPTPSDMWRCTCGHVWHTFDTGGVCPSCKKAWEMTQCLAPSAGGCSKQSPHLEWYRNLDDWLKEQIEKIRIRVAVES